jgi:SnoaL-like domain
VSEVVIRDAIAVDRRDWGLFAGCFTEPVHADYSENGLPATDFARDDLVRIVRDAVNGYSATQHLSSNHSRVRRRRPRPGDLLLVDVRTRVYVEGGEGTEVIVLHGLYDNHMVRTGGGWRIERLTQHVSWREVRRITLNDSPSVGVILGFRAQRP